MIFKKLRNNFSLLIDSSRHVWTFELAYKLVAFAVIFPIVLFAINFLMKIAGVNYLTNEYIQRTMTHPVVIFAIFLAIGIFVFYCTYEMTYLSVCFETKRTSCNASLVDIFYNSYKVFKNVFKPRHVGLSIFYFISILASNVTVWFNVLYSETNTNLIKMYIIRNHWYIKVEVIFVFIIIYAIVIPGIYAMNICMMEGLGFREAYKKSARMVKKHPMGTISALVVYNLVMLAIIGITYVLISVFLVAGVKILNMAYLGNAIFLSALRTERLIIKCILVCVAIPLSFAYRTTGVDENIANMTYKEVRRLDAGSWYSVEYKGEKVPGLREVLELAQGKIKLNIELKPADNSEELARKTVALIEKYNMENDCVITSFSSSALSAAKSCDENIRVGYILSAAYGEYYDMKNIDFFSVNAAFLSKRTIDAIHNSGKQVYAWTVNNKDSIKNLTNKGVDGVITDNPVLARETIYSRDTSETIINMIRYVFNQ